MLTLFRNAVFAVPFGVMAALVTHTMRFGDDHSFGGDANEAIVTLALGGTLALALAILHVFLARGTTILGGTVARSRLSALVPHPLAISAIAALVYYGIEALEGHAPELGVPALTLALVSIALASLLRRLTAFFARFVAEIAREWIAQLDACARIVLHLALRARPLHPQLACSTRRLGRAPPNGRRFS
ncbi:MAG: hypothetical protein NVSMB5_13220 [Candidatus Velthaea sp.]